MQNIIERFKELPTANKIIWIATPIIIVLLNVLIIVIAVVNMKPRVAEIVEVVDYGSLAIEIPKKNREALSEQLYYLLVEHFEVLEEARAVVATIRPESLEVNKSNGMTGVSFIVDIDSFQQSFLVDLVWNDNLQEQLPEDTLVECVQNELSKYPGVMCYGMYMNSDDIELYVPYYGRIASGEEYVMRERYYADGSPYLEIAIDSCGDRAILDSALADAKGWLADNGLDVSEYSFEVPSHYCPGGAL